MKYDCLIIDDEKLLADSTAEYFNLFGVTSCAVIPPRSAGLFSRIIRRIYCCLT